MSSDGMIAQEGNGLPDWISPAIAYGTPLEPLFDSPDSDLLARQRVLVEWLTLVPNDKRSRILGRLLRSDKHCGAFWELYCAAWIRAEGYDVVWEVPCGEKNIDLGAVSDGELVFAVECATVRESEEHDRREAMRREFTDAFRRELNDLPGAHLNVHFFAEGVRPFPVDALADFVRTNITREHGGELEWEHLGWSIAIDVLDESADRLTISNVQFERFTPLRMLRNKLREKAYKYEQKPDCPFVIAINSVEHHMTKEMAFEALYGERVTLIDPDGGPTSERLQENGFLRRRTGWHGDVVSGYLHGSLVTYLNMDSPQHDPVLFRAPFPRRELPTDLTVFDWTEVEAAAESTVLHRIWFREGTLSSLLALGDARATGGLSAARVAIIVLVVLGFAFMSWLTWVSFR